jgi:hypothetical protein
MSTFLAEPTPNILSDINSPSSTRPEMDMDGSMDLLESEEMDSTSISEDLDAEETVITRIQPLVFEGLQDVSRMDVLGLPMIYRRGANFRMGKTLTKGPRHLKVSSLGMKTRKQLDSSDTYVLAPVLMSKEVYQALYDQPENQFETINQMAQAVS